jgi:hypothetical protein
MSLHPCEKLYRRVRKIALGFAVLLCAYSIIIVVYYRPVRAQSSSEIIEEVWKNSAQVGDLKANLGNDELSIRALQTKVGDLSDRISRLETTSESSNRLIMGTLGGIIMILIERGMALITKRRRGLESREE